MTTSPSKDLPLTTAAVAAAASTTPAAAATIRPFKLRVGVPGHDGEERFLCRLTGDAMAYQSYCGIHGTPRIFTWYHHRDGKAYLKDQEGHWLSYDALADCLYMAYWNNAVAWKIEGGRLIRVSDGAVVSFNERQRWPLSSSKFLQALPPSDLAVTVVEVAEALSPLEQLVATMAPIYEKRHAPTEDDPVDRYFYGKSDIVIGAGGAGPVAERQRYDGHKVAFFAVKEPAAAAETVAVHRLKMWVEAEQRAYYKLSLATSEGGYTLEDAGKPEPNFYAFASAAERTDLHQVYEHWAPTPSGQRRYCYDFMAAGHDGWSEGTPIFRAITVTDAERALVHSIGSESARNYAAAWVARFGDDIAALLQSLTKDDVDASVAEKFQRFFEGMPAMRYMTLGAGVHGGYGAGTAGVELGSIWNAEDFGKVPIREPLADYSVEWVTFGGVTGIDIGGSADVLSIGHWFGDLGQIEGACNGITIAGQYGVGLAITLLWDGSWKGANFGPHPIGVTAIVAVGVEFGAGVFYNASATQFWHRRPSFPAT